LNDTPCHDRAEAREDGLAERLLFTCLRQTGHIRDAQDSGRSGADDGKAAWQTICLHGLAPLAAAVFSGDRPPAPLPAEWPKDLKSVLHRCVRLHQLALNALAEIAPKFKQAGVPCAVLKGPHLYEAYYDRRFPRPYADIDLLVRRQDLDRALALLNESGYRAAGGRLHQFIMRRVHFHLVLRPETRAGLNIELHRSLVDRANLYRVDEEAVLSRAVEWGADTARFGVLSVEDTFLYLGLHLAKHGLFNRMGLQRGFPAEWFCRPASGNRLIWYVDLDLFLRAEQERMDWNAVRRRAAEWNILPDVLDSLRVMSLLLPDSPAAAAIQILSPGAAGASASRGPRARFPPPPREVRGMDFLMRMNSVLRFRPARLLFLARLFFPAPRDLRAYHRNSRWPLPVLYLRHACHMPGKLLR